MTTCELLRYRCLVNTKSPQYGLTDILVLGSYIYSALVREFIKGISICFNCLSMQLKYNKLLVTAFGTTILLGVRILHSPGIYSMDPPLDVDGCLTNSA